MKKLAFICLTLLMSGVAEAQFQKGDIQIGSSLRFSRQKFVSNDINIISIQPKAGLFLTENASLGVIFGYRNTTTRTFSNASAGLSDRLFEYGVYSRFHKRFGERIYFFVQPSFLFGSGKNDLSSTSSANVSTINAQLAPGFTYFLTRKWAFEMSFSGLRYTRIKEEGPGLDQTIGQDDFNLNFNNMDLGISFYLRK